MEIYKLEKLGPRPSAGPPKVLSVINHSDIDFEAAFRSAKRIVQTTFETQGVGGFRLTDSAGNSQIWFVGDDDA